MSAHSSVTFGAFSFTQFNRALGYLRHHDKIGFLSSLALDDESADAWVELYALVRKLDRDSERDPTASAALPAEFGARLLACRPELTPLLAEGIRWPVVETRLYGDLAPRPVSVYFDLMYYRGFIPVYIGAVLAMPDEDRRWLAAYSVYLGCGGQLIDDTLDLVDDIGNGRLFITQEELDWLSLTSADLGTASGLRRITELRNQWALAYFLRAYRVTSAFRPANRPLARSFLEFSMRALLDGRVRPLPARVLADQERFMEEEFGIVSHLFDVPFPNEVYRRAVSRPFVERVIKRYALVSIEEARARYAAYPRALPASLMIERIRGLPAADLPPLDADLPDGRRPLTLLHYGPAGVLPTVVDVLRVITGL